MISKPVAHFIFCAVSVIAYSVGTTLCGTVEGLAMMVSFWVGALIIGLTIKE